MKRARLLNRHIALFAILSTIAAVGAALLLIAWSYQGTAAAPSTTPLSLVVVPRNLPNDCSIVATEAATRLAATGAWTHIICLQLRDLKTGERWAHSLVVWQAPTTHQVCIYDKNGTLELRTQSHNAAELARAFIFAAKLNDVEVEAHFW